MIESPREVYLNVVKIFSDEGLSIGNLNIRIKNAATINIEKDEDHTLRQIKVSFEEDKPVISFKKIIKIKVVLNAIVFREDGGILMLDFFPDIPFKYSWIENE